MGIFSFTAFLGTLFGTFGALFFAMRSILIKKATVTGNPLEAVLVSYLINLFTFLPLAFLFHGFALKFTVKSILAFIGAGLFGSFLGRTFSFLGIERVGASRTMPISNGFILLGSVLGIILLGEPITLGHFCGIILLVIGVLFVSYEIRSEDSNFSPGLRISPDLVFPLGALLFFSLDSVVAKIGLLEGTPVLAGLSLKFAVALSMMSGYFLFHNESLLKPFTVKERSLYFWAGIVGSLAMGFYYLALSLARVVVVLPFIGFTPLFVLTLTYLYLQKLEKITIPIILGTVLVVGGIVITSLFM